MVDNAQGAVVGAPASTPAPAAGGDRASILAGMAALRASDEAALETPAPTAPTDEVEPGEAPAAAAVETPAEPAPTPSALEKQRRAEVAAKRELAAAKAKLESDFAAREAEWKPKLAKFEQMEAAAIEAKRDPIALLKHLGFDESDFEGLAMSIYGHSPKGAADPRYKAQAEATAAKHAEASRMAQLEAKIASLESGLTAKEQAAQEAQAIDEYYGTLTKGVSDTTPLAKAALAKSPAKTRNALLAIADRLFVESDDLPEFREAPSAAQVLAEYEKVRLAELEELGIDPATLTRPAAPAKPTTKPATTLSPTGTSATTAPKSKEVTREDLLAGMQRLRAQGAS